MKLHGAFGHGRAMPYTAYSEWSRIALRTDAAPVEEVSSALDSSLCGTIHKCVSRGSGNSTTFVNVFGPVNADGVLTEM